MTPPLTPGNPASLGGEERVEMGSASGGRVARFNPPRGEVWVGYERVMP